MPSHQLPTLYSIIIVIITALFYSSFIIFDFTVSTVCRFIKLDFIVNVQDHTGHRAIGTPRARLLFSFFDIY